MKDIKSLFESFQKPVSEAGWESIANDSKVVKFNKMRHVRRIATYSIGGFVAAAAITSAVIFALPNKDNGTVAAEQSTEAVTTTVAQATPSTSNEVIAVSQPTAKSGNEQLPQTNAVPVTVSIDNSERPVSNTTITEPTSKPNVLVSNVPARPQAISLTPKASHSVPSNFTTVNTTLPKLDMPSHVDEFEAEPLAEQTNFTPRNAKEDELPESFWAPNSFTPNADGLNDRFRVYVNEKDYTENSDTTKNIDLSTFELNIFSRNGQLVFHTRNIEEEWNGTIQNSGVSLEPGVYVYTVRFKLNKKDKYKKGTITLLK